MYVMYVCVWLNLVISLEGDTTNVDALKPFIECTQFIGDIYIHVDQIHFLYCMYIYLSVKALRRTKFPTAALSTMATNTLVCITMCFLE